LRALSHPTQDTSVELEISNSDPVLALLTTTDGTLAPLLPPKKSRPYNHPFLAEQIISIFKVITNKHRIYGPRRV
jgi:hypothetical protein